MHRLASARWTAGRTRGHADARQNGLPACRRSLRRELLAAGKVSSFRAVLGLSCRANRRRGLWAVLQGEVSFSKVGASGNEFIYHVGGPGFWFGAFGVLTGLHARPRRSTAVSRGHAALSCRAPRTSCTSSTASRATSLRLVRLPLERGVELLDLRSSRSSGRARVARVASRSCSLLRRIEHGPRRQRRPVAAARVAGAAGGDDRPVAPVGQPRAPRTRPRPAPSTVGFRQIRILDPDRLEAIANETD